MPFLIEAAAALTNGCPTLARAEVVFVPRIETYDPTSERTQPADALRCFPTAGNQMAAISSCNMTCWQDASSVYERQKTKTSAHAWLHRGCSSVGKTDLTAKLFKSNMSCKYRIYRTINRYFFTCGLHGGAAFLGHTHQGCKNETRCKLRLASARLSRLSQDSHKTLTNL